MWLLALAVVPLGPAAQCVLATPWPRSLEVAWETRFCALAPGLRLWPQPQILCLAPPRPPLPEARPCALCKTSLLGQSPMACPLPPTLLRVTWERVAALHP